MAASYDTWSPFARVYDPLKAGSIDGTDTEPHDHAIVRAMKAHYKPNKLVEGDPKCTLFVGRLNPETTEANLRNFFGHFGEIAHCRLVLDIVTGFSKCYGFVEFKERRAAIEAYKETFKTQLDNYEIFVDFECERVLEGWVPRRLGGGFSGKKESGQLRFGGRDRPFRKPINLMKSARSTGRSDLQSEEPKHCDDRPGHRSDRFDDIRGNQNRKRRYEDERHQDDRSYRDKESRYADSRDSHQNDRSYRDKESRHTDSRDYERDGETRNYKSRDYKDRRGDSRVAEHERHSDYHKSSKHKHY